MCYLLHYIPNTALNNIPCERHWSLWTMSVLGSFGSSDSSDISSMVSLSQYFISLGFTTIARFSNFCTNNITHMIKSYNCTEVGGWLTRFRLALYFFIRESCLFTSSKSSLSSNFQSAYTLILPLHGSCISKGRDTHSSTG